MPAWVKYCDFHISLSCSSSKLALLEFHFSYKPMPFLSNLSNPFLLYQTNNFELIYESFYQILHCYLWCFFATQVIKSLSYCIRGGVGVQPLSRDLQRISQRSHSANSQPDTGPQGRQCSERPIVAVSPEPSRPSGLGAGG